MSDIMEKTDDEKYCPTCRAVILKKAEICPKCGVRQVIASKTADASEKDWLITLLLCIFLWSVGAHRFYVGKIGSGVIMLLIHVGSWATIFFTIGIPFTALIVWAIIDLIYIITGKFKEKINALPGFKIATPSQQNPKGHIDSDPLKLLIRLDRLNLNGYQLSRILRETHGINIECGGPGLVLAMMSMFHDKRDWEKLYLALSQISSQYPGKRKIEKTPAPDIPIQALTPRKAYKAKKHVLPLENSVGKIAGEMVTVYPPGIPCLWPGEVIDKSIEEYLNWAKKNGAYVQKFSGPDLDKISIINGAW